MIGCCCRESTADQSLERQLSATAGYAQKQLGAEGDVDIDDRTTIGDAHERVLARLAA